MSKSFLFSLIVCCLFLVSCTDSSNAVRVLEENGYTQVEITGYSFFACSKDDAFHTGFTAISPAGKKISGTVCSGWIFKNSTIRFK